MWFRRPLIFCFIAGGYFLSVSLGIRGSRLDKYFHVGNKFLWCWSILNRFHGFGGAGDVVWCWWDMLAVGVCIIV